MAEIKAFGITKSLFILDRGFYSESNISEMSKEGIDFIGSSLFCVGSRVNLYTNSC
jgi:transposase